MNEQFFWMKDFPKQLFSEKTNEIYGKWTIILITNEINIFWTIKKMNKMSRPQTMKKQKEQKAERAQLYMYRC